MEKIKTVGKAISYVMVILILKLVFSMVLQVALTVYGAIVHRLSGEQLERFVGQVIYDGNVNLVFSLFVYFVLFALFFMYNRFFQKEKEYISGISIRNVTCLVIGGIALQVFIQPMMTWLGMLLPNTMENYMKMTELVSGAKCNSILLVLAVILIGPFVEEYVFRRTLYRTLRKAWGVPFSAVISATLFGIYHLDVIQIIYCTLVGIVMCLIYEKTQSFIATAFTHAVFNGATYILLFMAQKLSVEQQQMLEQMDVLIFGISLGIILLVLFLIRREKCEVNEVI